MTTTTPVFTQDQRPVGFSIRQLWPLALLALAIGTFLALRLDMYLAFEALRDNRALLGQFVSEHAVLASILYVAIYAAVVAASLPGGALLTVERATGIVGREREAGAVGNAVGEALDRRLLRHAQQQNLRAALLEFTFLNFRPATCPC
jgi:hypothetical protein